MAELDANPYASPVHESESTATVTRWRVIPAAVLFCLGLASLAFGMFAVAVMTYVVVTQDGNEAIGGMLAGCVV
jgi:hypothetical protein